MGPRQIQSLAPDLGVEGGVVANSVEDFEAGKDWSKRNSTSSAALRIVRSSGVSGVASQSLIFSPPAAARRRPSGPNARPRPELACPLRVKTGSPFAASQSLTAPPPGGGETAAVGAERHFTDPGRVPAHGEDLTPSVGVPEPYGRVDGTGRGETAAVRAKRHTGDPARVPAQGADLVPRSGIPEPHGRIGAGGGDSAAVGAKRQAQDHARMPREDVDLLPGVGIPEPYVSVATTRGETAAIGAKLQDEDQIRVAAEDSDHLAVIGVPQPDGVIEAGGSEAAAIRAKRHAKDSARVSTEDPGLLAGIGVPQPHSLIDAGGGERRPSGLNATDATKPACPRSVSASCSETMSQSLTVPSVPQEARHRPSGLKVTKWTMPACPTQGLQYLTRAGVPEPRGAVDAARARGDGRRGYKPRYVPRHDARSEPAAPAGLSVPEPHSGVAAARGDSPAVRAVSHAPGRRSRVRSGCGRARRYRRPRA